MAIYHLLVTPVQRSKGHSVVARAANRSGTVLYEEQTRQTHDFRNKRGVVHSEIITPAGAQEWTRDRLQLWNRADLAEKRVNAQPAREIQLALPCELTDEQNIAVVSKYAREVIVSSGMVADVSIHRADRHGDERNIPAYILVTMRELAGEGFSKTKQRDWSRRETLRNWRGRWAKYLNDALEDAGYDARVDHRTLEAQGINRIATRHLGKAASAMERRGKATQLGNRNRKIREHNRNLDQLVNELAALDAEIC